MLGVLAARVIHALFILLAYMYVHIGRKFKENYYTLTNLTFIYVPSVFGCGDGGNGGGGVVVSTA